MMNHKNFWDLLNEKQGSLTKSGTIIADYLTKHAQEAQFLPFLHSQKPVTWQKQPFTASVSSLDLKAIMK